MALVLLSFMLTLFPFFNKRVSVIRPSNPQYQVMSILATAHDKFCAIYVALRDLTCCSTYRPDKTAASISLTIIVTKRDYSISSDDHGFIAVVPRTEVCK
eukprot:scaffold462613_cov20-Prasinocladus_malaysianus.AAC.1